MTSTVDRVPLLGRGGELRALVQRLRETCAGAGGLVLIGGEPGVGKTRLLEELAAAARRQEARVLWGHCYEGEGAPPLWPWIELLRAAIRGGDPETLRKALGPGAGDVARLLPELHAALPDLPPAADGEATELQFRLFDAVVAFLRRLADRPLLVLLEDLHWADAASLRLLEFAVRALADTAILVAGSFRDTETDGSPLAETVGRLVRLHRCDRLLLRGLSREEVASLVAHVAGGVAPADLVASIAEETGGNPLFVTELARALTLAEPEPAGSAPYRKRALPRTVHEVIAQRMSGLSPSCRHILTVAAVAGGDFSIVVLDRVLEGAGDDLLQALEEAEIARVIVPVAGAPGEYRFNHAVIRDALYESLASARRLRLHRQVAEALERMWGDDPEHLAELAHHFTQAAAAPQKALHYTERAAARSVQLHAYEEGVRQYVAALRALSQVVPLDNVHRCRLLLALADTQSSAGRIDLAVSTFEQAAEIARTLYHEAECLPDRPLEQPAALLARAALGVGRLAITAGKLHEPLVRLLEDALVALGDADTAQRAMLLARLAQELMFSGEPERAVALARDAVAIARRLGDRRALFACLFAYLYTVSAPDLAAERLAATTELQQLAEALRDQELGLRAMRRRIEELLQRSDIGALDAAIVTFQAAAEKLRQPFFRWEAGLFQAMRALLDGRFADAERLAVQAKSLRLDPEDADGLAFLGLQLWPVRAEQGRSGELIEGQRRTAERFAGVPAHRAALVLMLCEAGRTREAQCELDRLAGVPLAASPRDKSWFSLCAHLAQALAILGDADRAAALYELAHQYPSVVVVVSSAVVCYGSMSRYLGLLAGTVARAGSDPADAGRWYELAAHHFDDALVQNERLRAPALLAHTRHEYAALLVARLGGGSAGEGQADVDPDGRALLVERAGAFLRDASAAARSLDMLRLIGQTDALRVELEALAATGPARRTRPVLPAGLTPREVELLQQVFAGRSNREIAEDLVLTVATVQNHLASIYRKLDVRSRSEAAAFAFQHGLLDPQSER